MSKKERKKRIYEQIRAEQAEYDEQTRRLKERIAHHRSRAEAERRRASS